MDYQTRQVKTSAKLPKPFGEGGFKTPESKKNKQKNVCEPTKNERNVHEKMTFCKIKNLRESPLFPLVLICIHMEAMVM